MVTDGVRAASYLPTDGYLDPSRLTYALAEGARAGGARIFTHTRVEAIDVARRPRARRADDVGPDRGRGRRQRRRDVRRRARAPGRRPRPGRALRPRVPRHPALPRARARRAPAHAARPRQPRLLPRGGRRAWSWAATSGAARRGRSTTTASTGSRRTSTAACSRRTGRASRSSPSARACACRRWATSASRGSSTGPRRSRPTTSSASARPRSPASSSRRASARTGWPARAAWGGSWPTGSSTARRPWTSPRWTSGASGGLPVAGVHAGPRPRDLRDVLRHRVPRARAARGPAAAALERVPVARGARRRPSARRRAGSA